MRISLSLNPKNDKDKKIIDFLESRYNSAGYIKEVLYQLALGNGFGAETKIINTTPIQIEEDPKEEIEDFEEIIGLENIPL